MNKKSPSERGLKFSEWFRDEMLGGARKLAPGWREKWAKCFDDLVKLDGRELRDIARVCRWARGDAFWRKNFFTPLKLRQWQVDKAGEKIALYFDVFLESAKAEAGEPAGAGCPPEAAEAVRACHAAFCQASGMDLSLDGYAARWVALLERSEYRGDAALLAADVRHVVWCIARGIATGKRNEIGRASCRERVSSPV